MDTNGFDVLSNDAGSSAPPSFMDSGVSAPADTSAPDLGNPAYAPSNLLSGQSPQPAAPAASAPAPTQAPSPASNQPISWRDVLRGALAGMAGASQPTRGRGGFAAGVGMGAGAELQDQANQQEFKLKQQQQQSNIKFQDAQAANLAVETAIRDKQLHSMDQKDQDAHNEASVSMVERMKALGITPTIVADNNHGGAEVKAGLQQLTQSHGGVPPMFTVNVGGQIIGYDLNQLAQTPQGLAEVNRVRAITNPGSPALTAQQFQQMDPKMRNELLNNSLGFSNPMPSEDALLVYKNYLQTVQAQPDSPDKTANVEMLQGITTRMESALDSAKARADKQKADSIAATGPAEAKVAGQKAAATGELQKNIAEANKADRADGQGKNAGQMMVGSLPDGTQIAGTVDELKSVGVTTATKLPASEQSKVVIARQLISPNGLISNVEKDIAAFSPEELSAIGARWNEFTAGKLGAASDQRYTALRTDTKLLSTALMQAHVGSKGSEQIMEHFSNLADAGKMDGDTLKTAIATEKRYVTEKAMLPKGTPAGQPVQPQQTSGHKVGDKIVQNGKAFTVTSVDQNGKVTGAN